MAGPDLSLYGKIKTKGDYDKAEAEFNAKRATRALSQRADGLSSKAVNRRALYNRPARCRGLRLARLSSSRWLKSYRLARLLTTRQQ